jgi:DNA-binding transcriptional ArsR family regulator
LDDLERLLWWLVQGSAGAPTRVKLLVAIRSKPRNAQQLTDEVGLDYTTVRHHLRVLTNNHLVETTGDRYGQLYFLSSRLEQRWSDLERIAARRTNGRGGR